MSDKKNNKFGKKITKRGLGRTHAPKVKEIRNQKLTLVLTKNEKAQVAAQAEADGRSQSQYLIKVLYNNGVLKKNSS